MSAKSMRSLIISICLLSLVFLCGYMNPYAAGVNRGIQALDYFTYSNGELASVSSNTFVRWETHANAGTINVASNQIQFIKGTENWFNAIYAHKDTFSSRYVYAQIQITNDTGLGTGVAINLQDQGSLTWDGYVLSVHLDGATKEIEIWRVTDGGTWTKMGDTDTTTGYATGDIFRLAHEAGDNIVVYKNGVVISGVGGVDGSPYTAARVGISLGTEADGTDARSDNWEGGDIR